jgi:hypothetical protein
MWGKNNKVGVGDKAEARKRSVSGWATIRSELGKPSVALNERIGLLAKAE